jgi:hypothetical protein
MKPRRRAGGVFKASYITWHIDALACDEILATGHSSNIGYHGGVNNLFDWFIA